MGSTALKIEDWGRSQNGWYKLYVYGSDGSYTWDHLADYTWDTEALKNTIWECVNDTWVSPVMSQFLTVHHRATHPSHEHYKHTDDILSTSSLLHQLDLLKNCQFPGSKTFPGKKNHRGWLPTDVPIKEGLIKRIWSPLRGYDLVATQDIRPGTRITTLKLGPLGESKRTRWCTETFKERSREFACLAPEPGCMGVLCNSSAEGELPNARFGRIVNSRSSIFATKVIKAGSQILVGSYASKLQGTSAAPPLRLRTKKKDSQKVDKRRRTLGGRFQKGYNTK